MQVQRVAGQVYMNVIGRRDLDSYWAPHHHQLFFGDWDAVFPRRLHYFFLDLGLRLGVVGIEAGFAFNEVLELPVIEVGRAHHKESVDTEPEDGKSDKW